MSADAARPQIDDTLEVDMHVQGTLLLTTLALAAPTSMAQARPDDGHDIVFDFRPRIVTPAPPGVAPRRDNLAVQRNVHLHVFRQPTGTPDCVDDADDHDDGNRRVPLGDGSVGVVLSGGISKGLAFIGALDVIDRVGIRVDKIAGTSMGAVIGAFYAAGYSPNQLYAPPSEAADDILGGINWRTLFTDIPNVRHLSLNQQLSWGLGESSMALPRVYQGGLRSGQNLSSFLGKYLLAPTAAANSCFDNLYVPFRATATNVSRSKPAILRRGDLATSVRASLSFPVLLTPTYIDGDRYIDGGILNNYPVDVILEREAAARQPTDKPKTPKAPNKPQSAKYLAILGFDVSDTNTSVLDEPGLLQIGSALGVIGSVDDAISAAISRETAKSRDTRGKCHRDAVEPAGDDPCLLDFKFTTDGGFTDFSQPQIETFVASGRAHVIRGLCRFADGATPGCASITSKVDDPWSRWSDLSPKDKLELQGIELLAIDEIRAWLGKSKWHRLLHDPRRTLDAARPDLPAEAAPKLEAMAQALPAGHVAVGGSDDAMAAPPETLQGLRAVWHPDRGLELSFSDALRKDSAQALREQLLADVTRTVSWLAQRLRQPACGFSNCVPAALEDLPDFSKVARIRVSLTGDRVVVHASSWMYQVQGLVTKTGLTERGALNGASVSFWDLGVAARERRLDKLTTRFNGDKHADASPGREGRGLRVTPAKADDSAAATFGLTHKRDTPAPAAPGRWQREIHAAMRARLLDVRYFDSDRRGCSGVGDEVDCAPELSLPWLFETLQERYYANAAAEYFRIEGIAADSIDIAEKHLNRTAAGSIHFAYQYDYRNKHTVGLKHVYDTHNDAWFKPTRVITSVATNEPTARPEGMRLVDARLLYFPSLADGTFDFSVNPYAARRRHISGDEIPPFGYDETGVVLTVSTRFPKPRLPTRKEFLYAPFWIASHRTLDDFSSPDIDLLRSRLRNPHAGAGPAQVNSLAQGLSLAQYIEDLTIEEQGRVTLIRVNGMTFTDAAFDIAAEIAVEPGPTSAVVGGRLFYGRLSYGRDARHPDPAHPVPIDELYSLGGYYPLAERSLWGRKRVDYLGGDINSRWGTSLYFLEGRYSLTRWTPVTYFAPYAKVQVDLVAQAAKIGFKDDPERRWRGAAGVVASAYLPSLSSIKPRLSAAAGGESWRGRRVFTSAEILF